MGSDVELLLQPAGACPPGAAIAAAIREMRRLEARLSRFLPASDLSRANRAGRVDGAADLAAVLRVALAGRAATDGRFDPTLHDAVAAAGYDRPFARVPAEAGPPPGPARRGGGRVEVAPGGRVRLAPGVRIDLGGVAKGWAADRLCDLLAPAGACLVNAGGDVAVRGVPAGGAWVVGLDAPGGPGAISLVRGAVATSGRDRRRWRRAGRDLHHVIDPRTGRPAATDLMRVTVVAGTAAAAEVLATGLLVAGAAAARREADRRGIPALLVPESGPAVAAGGLAIPAISLGPEA
ncbi:MAG: FAD:protein FMN transferase [Thermoleophilia bacterium]